VGHRQLGRLREQHGHAVATLDAKAAQGVGEAVRGALELEEAPLLRRTVTSVAWRSQTSTPML
jgi:hypothetical protein